MKVNKSVTQKASRSPGLPFRFWQSKDGKYFGWLEGSETTRNESLCLSRHSSIALAKENNSRLITDEIRKYIVN